MSGISRGVLDSLFHGHSNDSLLRFFNLVQLDSVLVELVVHLLVSVVSGRLSTDFNIDFLDLLEGLLIGNFLLMN